MNISSQDKIYTSQLLKYIFLKASLWYHHTLLMAWKKHLRQFTAFANLDYIDYIDYIYILMCQPHPALVKRVQWPVCLFQFLTD